MSRLKPGSAVGPFPYRIVKQLGAGSGNMSDVYLATVGDPNTTTSFVVIKISKSHEDHRDFFEDTIFNESERLRKLDHRGVVRILPIQTDNKMRVQPYAARANSLPGNPWFLVLEHLIGGSLAEVLQSYKQLDTALTIEITRKLAQTLEYLHYNDLVHLDLKPENILFRRPLETGGRIEPVLIDFGIARNTGQPGLEGRTLHYAPPERVLNNRGNAPPETLPRPSPAMDIYSLGVVFYQMLAGRRPFEGRTARSISSAILEAKPTRPSKYSNLVWKELDDLVMEMLSKDPIQRPTAGELVERLDDLRSQPTYQLPSSPSGDSVQIAAVRPQARWAGVRKAVVALLLLFLLLLGIGETYAYLQNGRVWLPSLGDLQSVPSVALAYGQSIFNQFNSTAPSTPTATTVPTVGTPPPPTEATNTADAVPTATAVIEDETVTPTASATQTATKIPSATPTSKPPTSTPVPAVAFSTLTATPTKSVPTKAATATPVPSHTPTKAATPTVVPTKKATVASGATNTPKPIQPSNRSVTLVSPASNTQGNGQATFSWKANFPLAAGQAFHVVFWRANEDPMKDGRGWFKPTTQLSINDDLRKYDVNNETYYWGVLLVQTNPYRKIQYLGGGWKYIFTE